MRTIVIGDIHGGLRCLIDLLEKVQPTTEDKFIFLGDYVDGWSQAAQLIDYLIEFKSNYNCLFIKGNHDQWCEDWLIDNDAKPFLWLNHGGKATIKSYTNHSEEQRKEHIAFFQSMLLQHLDLEKRLFIHAGFSSMHGIKKEFYESNFSWDRTLWEMAFALKDMELDPNAPNYPKRLAHYKEIYIGHTPTTNFGSKLPIQAQNLFNLDTGAGFTGCLSAMDIETKQIWQSKGATELYPDEKGRN